MLSLADEFCETFDTLTLLLMRCYNLLQLIHTYLMPQCADDIYIQEEFFSKGDNSKFGEVLMQARPPKKRWTYFKIIIYRLCYFNLYMRLPSFQERCLSDYKLKKNL